MRLDALAVSAFAGNHGSMPSHGFGVRFSLRQVLGSFPKTML